MRVGLKARKKKPYLARFKCDWATAAMLLTYMRNSRKYAHYLEKHGGPDGKKIIARMRAGVELGVSNGPGALAIVAPLDDAGLLKFNDSDGEESDDGSEESSESEEDAAQDENEAQA